jgi:hypothetical protein
LFHGPGARWRSVAFYRILAGMRPVIRGLIISAFWLGLALGFTGALSSVLQDRQTVDRDDARSVIR